MKKISVIMPAYNSEKTIEKSIKSVTQQTYSNFELIVINDGSTDNTEQIIRDLANSDGRIHYISKENGGVSSARNIGIDYSTGEYIFFIDSDDCYQKNMLTTLVYYIETYKCDFVSCSYVRVSENYSTPEKTYFEEGFYSKKRLEEIIYPSIIADKTLLYKVPLNIVTKAFRKSLIDKYNIRFNEKLHRGEDLVFSREYFLYAESFYYLPDDKYYKYLDNDSSATNSFIKNREEILPYSLNYHKEVIRKFPQYNFTEQISYLHVRIALSSTSNILKYMKGTKQEIMKELALILENEQIIDACTKVDSNNFDIIKRFVYILIKYKRYNLLYLITKSYNAIYN